MSPGPDPVGRSQAIAGSGVYIGAAIGDEECLRRALTTTLAGRQLTVLHSKLLVFSTRKVTAEFEPLPALLRDEVELIPSRLP